MIPNFPQFKRLSIEDGEAVDAHTRNFPCYSDFNFTSLWAWDVKRERELSQLNGNLVVKFSDYVTGEPFLSFLGTQRPQQTASTLLEYSESLGLPPSLHLTPESSIRELDANAFTVAEDPANHDYIYLAQALTSMLGSAYRSKRQCLNKFERQHRQVRFEVLPLDDLFAQECVRSVAGQWLSQRAQSVDAHSSDYEMHAIERTIELGACRELLVGVLITSDSATSFTLDELSNSLTAVSHFSKTASRTRGENEYLCRAMARYVVERQVVYLNWEEDLGIASLRASKTSFVPSGFLRKFSVARASPPGRQTLLPRRSIKPPGLVAPKHSVSP